MGYIRHDAIIVTHYDKSGAEVSRQAALDLDLPVTEVVTTINGYSSYMIVPDGSKEGWEDSNNGDTNRELWKMSNGGDWVHVRFGGDEEEAYIVDLS